MVSVTVCVSVCVHGLKGKQLDLSTPNWVHIFSMAGPRLALTLRSKGRGHAVIKCAAGVGMQVDTTAWVSSLQCDVCLLAVNVAVYMLMYVYMYIFLSFTACLLCLLHGSSQRRVSEVRRRSTLVLSTVVSATQC